MKRMNRFPFKHIVVEDTKEVLVVCQSAITAMGIGAMVNKYYPGYTAKDNFRKLLAQKST